MVKTKRSFILGTCLLSGAAAIVSLVALATEQWVVADAVGDGVKLSTEYGLFNGIIKQDTPTTATYQITMTCLIGNNVCAMLCGGGDSILEKLYNNENVDDSNMANCAQIKKSFHVKNRDFPAPRAEKDNRVFINAGAWIITIFFLILSAALGLVATGVALWNVAANPIEIYFSTIGLYIYNGLALFFTILYFITWGAMFADIISRDVNIQFTLIGYASSEGRASLGYSYWINLIPLIFYCGSLVSLYIRQYLISREPDKTDVHDQDPTDPAIYIY